MSDDTFFDVCPSTGIYVGMPVILNGRETVVIDITLHRGGVYIYCVRSTKNTGRPTRDGRTSNRWWCNLHSLVFDKYLVDPFNEKNNIEHYIIKWD